MKAPSEWQEDDLQTLINSRAEESITLEFKRSDSLGIPGKPELDEKSKTEISKDVSAMANSAGGVIVYGIAEDKDEPHPAIALSPVDPQKFSKDWLEQVINSRIKPRIQELLIHSIQLTGTYAGQVAYIVCVPQSSTAHQA
jgi:predicted HTH transcriptional regulator